MFKYEKFRLNQKSIFLFEINLIKILLLNIHILQKDAELIFILEAKHFHAFSINIITNIQTH